MRGHHMGYLMDDVKVRRVNGRAMVDIKLRGLAEYGQTPDERWQGEDGRWECITQGT